MEQEDTSSLVTQFIHALAGPICLFVSVSVCQPSTFAGQAALGVVYPLRAMKARVSRGTW